MSSRSKRNLSEHRKPYLLPILVESLWKGSLLQIDTRNKHFTRSNGAYSSSYLDWNPRAVSSRPHLSVGGRVPSGSGHTQEPQPRRSTQGNSSESQCSKAALMTETWEASWTWRRGQETKCSIIHWKLHPTQYYSLTAESFIFFKVLP